MSGTSSVPELFASFLGRDPFIFELCGGAGYRLTVGFGGTLGCVQYSSADGSPPYMVAVTDTPQTFESKFFYAGGQQTEIPARFCLPIERIEGIVGEFIATGQRSGSAAWEEV